eukprot:Gb_30365 [translate_table: standard]
MAGNPAHGTVVEDIFGVLKVYSDGSIARTDDPNLSIPPSQQLSDENGGVLSKDVVLDANLGLWVRLYLPSQPTTRLPVVVYFHGGGFCCFSSSFAGFHFVCIKWAATIGAIIVSVNYRLAPEHRLPAAYDDSVAVLEWLRKQSMEQTTDGEAMDPWLNSRADFSKVFLMGDSSGGNIVHHLILRSDVLKRNPLQIKGLVLVQPFFGGEERTQSEMSCPESAVLTLKYCDMFWNLALPMEGSREHHFSNPFSPAESPYLAQAVLPPMVVVIGCHDLLRDRQLEYCRVLRNFGKQIQVLEFEEEEHAFYALKLNSESSEKLLQYTSQFINSMT